MKTEELMEHEVEEIPHFDGHEFDGLREALEDVETTFLSGADRFVQEYPWLCIAAPAAAGFAIGRAVRR